MSRTLAGRFTGYDADYMGYKNTVSGLFIEVPNEEADDIIRKQLDLIIEDVVYVGRYDDPEVRDLYKKFKKERNTIVFDGHVFACDPDHGNDRSRIWIRCAHPPGKSNESRWSTWKADENSWIFCFAKKDSDLGREVMNRERSFQKFPMIEEFDFT